jgi:hypothetical protein|nr:MAG TPA: hypothetical protein [Caudoviricetes sp.]
MGARVRTINKIGNGRYFTTSWKVSDYLICNILYFVFFYSYFLIFKYLFYVPIKWCVVKIIDIFKSKKQS